MSFRRRAASSKRPRPTQSPPFEGELLTLQPQPPGLPVSPPPPLPPAPLELPEAIPPPAPELAMEPELAPELELELDRMHVPPLQVPPVHAVPSGLFAYEQMP